MKNPSLTEIAESITQRLRPFPLSVAHKQDAVAITHAGDAFSMQLRIAVLRRPGSWRWTYSVAVLRKELSAVVSSGSIEGGFRIQEVSNLFMSHIENPFFYITSKANDDLAQFLLKELATKASREEFLDFLGTVWLTEFRFDIEHPSDRYRRTARVEHYMRPIMTIGSHLGVSVHDLNNLHDRLIKNVKASSLLKS